MENASYSLGSIINSMVSEGNLGSYERMEQCHECIKAFADGLKANFMTAGWRETAKDVSFHEYNDTKLPGRKKVLFTTPERRVLTGIYFKKKNVLNCQLIMAKQRKDKILQELL